MYISKKRDFSQKRTPLPVQKRSSRSCMIPTMQSQIIQLKGDHIFNDVIKTFAEATDAILFDSPKSAPMLSRFRSHIAFFEKEYRDSFQDGTKSSKTDPNSFAETLTLFRLVLLNLKTYCDLDSVGRFLDGCIENAEVLFVDAKAYEDISDSKKREKKVAGLGFICDFLSKLKAAIAEDYNGKKIQAEDRAGDIYAMIEVRNKQIGKNTASGSGASVEIERHINRIRTLLFPAIGNEDIKTRLTQNKN